MVTKGSARGQTGVVSLVLPDRDAVVVSGVNVRTVRVKPRLRNAKGTTEKREAPIASSNVSFFNQKSGKKIRVGYDGVGRKKKRVSRADGSAIPAPKKTVRKRKVAGGKKGEKGGTAKKT